MEKELNDFLKGVKDGFEMIGFFIFGVSKLFILIFKNKNLYSLGAFLGALAPIILIVTLLVLV